MAKLYKDFLNKNVSLQEGGKLTKYRKTVHSVVGATAGFPGWIPYRILRGLLQKCTKECHTFDINTPRRQRCLLSCKLKALQKYRRALEDSKSICDAMKNQEKCYKRLAKEIWHVDRQINKVKKQIAERF